MRQAGLNHLPATTVAASHDDRRRRGVDPGPARPHLHRRRPGTTLVGDITYIPTWEGWLYLASVIDCHTKACIGYAMADHMRTSLVTTALDMAARHYPLAEGVIFHSDRGTQDTSQEFADYTATLGVSRFVGRTGVCFDNAQAESFNAAVKVERVNRTAYPTHEHTRKDVTRYIEFRIQYPQASLRTRLPHPTRSLQRLSEHPPGSMNSHKSTVRKLRGSPLQQRGIDTFARSVVAQPPLDGRHGTPRQKRDLGFGTKPPVASTQHVCGSQHQPVGDQVPATAGVRTEHLNDPSLIHERSPGRYRAKSRTTTSYGSARLLTVGRGAGGTSRPPPPAEQDRHRKDDRQRAASGERPPACHTDMHWWANDQRTGPSRRGAVGQHYDVHIEVADVDRMQVSGNDVLAPGPSGGTARKGPPRSAAGR